MVQATQIPLCLAGSPRLESAALGSSWASFEAAHAVQQPDSHHHQSKPSPVLLKKVRMRLFTPCWFPCWVQRACLL